MKECTKTPTEWTPVTMTVKGTNKQTERERESQQCVGNKNEIKKAATLKYGSTYKGKR